jgi:hypothetical protein
MPLTNPQLRQIARTFCLLVQFPEQREFCVSFYGRNLPKSVVDDVGANFFQRPTGPDIKSGRLCVRQFDGECRYRWAVSGRPPGFSSGAALLTVYTDWSDVSSL